MNYKVLHEDTQQTLLERLLHIRGVDCAIDDFLSPTFGKYWYDPFLLSDMELGVERIIDAIKNKDRIMIFGDYDVDGVTSSYLLYTFIKEFLNYSNISIMYPDRLKDGYGLKNKHLDVMKEKSIDVIITVDNGITSLGEADYAKELGIDLIITDHHKDLPTLPQALAVINPQTSPDYPFKGLCGAAVAYKVVAAILHKCSREADRKQHVMKYLLPIVAIATVADVVPLVDENRLLVKRGLEHINQ